jgi:hypothetical protein
MQMSCLLNQIECRWPAANTGQKDETMILLSDVRRKLFDMSVEIASMSANLRDSEMPSDADLAVTTEGDIAYVTGELEDIEEKMDALRQYVFRLQA